MYHEYPKALYQAGELRTVADADDEAQARRDGFNDWHADQAADEVPVLAAEKAEVPAEVPAKRKTTKKAAA